MDEQHAISAAILAGGHSERMGTNKAFLRLGDSGPTLIEIVVARLAEAGFDAPLLVTNNPEEYVFLHLPFVPDEMPGSGPLGGVLSALVHSTAARVLVVGCDMPHLNPALLRYMASLPDNGGVLVPRWRDTSGEQQVEPLHAIYSRRCIEPIRGRIEAGHLSVRGLVTDANVPATYIEEAQVRQYDPSLASFRNVNTPEEWASLKRML